MECGFSVFTAIRTKCKGVTVCRFFSERSGESPVRSGLGRGIWRRRRGRLQAARPIVILAPTGPHGQETTPFTDCHLSSDCTTHYRTFRSRSDTTPTSHRTPAIYRREMSVNEVCSGYLVKPLSWTASRSAASSRPSRVKSLTACGDTSRLNSASVHVCRPGAEQRSWTGCPL